MAFNIERRTKMQTNQDSANHLESRMDQKGISKIYPRRKIKEARDAGGGVDFSTPPLCLKWGCNASDKVTQRCSSSLSCRY